MTEYTDIPQVNALYGEQQRVQSALTIIDSGGLLSAFTVSPPPPPPYDPNNPNMGMTMMSVQITHVGAVTPETMATLRANLVSRDAEINAELTALGVVVAPPTAYARSRAANVSGA